MSATFLPFFCAARLRQPIARRRPSDRRRRASTGRSRPACRPRASAGTPARRVDRRSARECRERRSTPGSGCRRPSTGPGRSAGCIRARWCAPGTPTDNRRRGGSSLDRWYLYGPCLSAQAQTDNAFASKGKRQKAQGTTEARSQNQDRRSGLRPWFCLMPCAFRLAVNGAWENSTGDQGRSPPQTWTRTARSQSTRCGRGRLGHQPLPERLGVTALGDRRDEPPVRLQPVPGDVEDGVAALLAEDVLEVRPRVEEAGDAVGRRPSG